MTDISSKAPQTALETVVGCNIASKYDWNVQIAIAICKAESGGNPLAENHSNYNGSNDKGLFQINSIHVTSGLIGDTARLDPIQNADAAYKIYKGSGFNAWSAYTNGAYRKHL